MYVCMYPPPLLLYACSPPRRFIVMVDTRLQKDSHQKQVARPNVTGGR